MNQMVTDPVSNSPTPVPPHEKQVSFGEKPNYWKISTLVLAVLLITVVTRDVWVTVEDRRPASPPELPRVTITSSPTVTPQPQATLTGTVRTGGQIDNNSYCAEGLYLVSAEGTYLIDEISTLQLRVFHKDTSVWNNTALLSDQQYVGKRVKVTGKYPAQEVFCQAAMCACDNFILVDQIYE